MRTVYISGAISSDPDYKEKFERAECDLSGRGYVVLNPARLIQVSPEKTWEDYMAEAILLLLKADSIYLLSDWKESGGARIERALAIKLNMEVLR